MLHPSFDSEEQQDAGEFLLLMLEAIHSLTRYPQLPVSPRRINFLVGIAVECQQGWERSMRDEGASHMRDLFYYQIISGISCDHCEDAGRNQESKTSLECSSILDVAIPPDFERPSLLQLLVNQFGDEMVDDYTCEDCGRTGCVSKMYWLSHLPEYIFIQLGRFAGHEDTSKINRFVDFPLQGLDLQPVVHPHLRGSMGTLYDCVGTIEHIGSSLESGHYKTNVRYDGGAQGGRCIEYNDHDVKEYEESQIVVGPNLILPV